MVAPYTKIDHATQVFAFTNRTISLKAHELQVCDANFRTCTIYTFHFVAIYAITVYCFRVHGWSQQHTQHKK